MTGNRDNRPLDGPQESSRGRPLDEAAEQRRLVALLLREQQLLGFEIHDGMVQEMTAALMFLESSISEIEPLMGRVPESPIQARALLQQAISEARQLLANLQPAGLERGGLVSALGELVERFRQRAAFEIRLDIAKLERLPAPVEHALYRIVQESLSNAVKHSRATLVTIDFKVSPSEVTLTLRDDGCGFEPAQAFPNHYGLVGIRERAKLLGGVARIEAAPGHGCCVRVVVPRDSRLEA